jgi:hypothetical protein
MKYKLKTNELCDFNDYIEDIINNELNPKITKMDKVAKKALWSGVARNTFVGRYDATMHELKKIPKVLETYLDFLDNVVTNYDDALSELEKKMKEIEEDLDIVRDPNEII